MPDIIITTLNAKYIHASLGLRYLFANMGSLQCTTQLIEYTIKARVEEIAENLLQGNPRIIGFGVYIWNTDETLSLIQLLRAIKPELVLILGGPEVSHEIEQQPIVKLADYVVTGAADIAFAELCHDILADEPPARKVVSSLPVALDQLKPPYPFYSDKDLLHRLIYVEASRGCPFKCEFCLSSLDKTAVPFDIDSFLQHMQLLIERGARHFKFVDRTFNLKAETSRQVLAFFLAQMGVGENATVRRKLFLHFELIPDRLPAILQDLLPLFPPGSLQFEIGIQTFNPDVQKQISRKQDQKRTAANLRWLREHTNAHIHADLIFGLPGENLDSFAAGFNQLYELNPQEIQVGILKRLRGTPLKRHEDTFDMRYQPQPPYRLLCNKDVSFETTQRIVRFARYWDIVGNSGRFPNTLPLLLDHYPFGQFLNFSDWLFTRHGQTHKIALTKLIRSVYEYMMMHDSTPASDTQHAIERDALHNGFRGKSWLRTPEPSPKLAKSSTQLEWQSTMTPVRQSRHTAN